LGKGGPGYKVSGEGKQSIQKHSTLAKKAFRFTIRTRLAHMVYWHEGIGARIILPRKKKALAFFVAGQKERIVRKKVYIPPQAPRPFITDAMKMQEPILKRLLENLSQRAIKRWPPVTVKLEI
jgi:hypothetical protein